MGEVVHLEDHGLEVHRWPTKLEQLTQALDILESIETLGSNLGDAQLWDATLALRNAINVLALTQYRGGGT